jgi:hypothetical protein
LYLLLDHRKVFFDAKKHAVSNSRSTGIGWECLFHLRFYALSWR